MKTAVLFVCLGNICRSPSAEAVFRDLAAKAGLDVDVDSAGTGSWHIGKPPHPPMIATAGKRGIDMGDLRARQIGAEDFDRFDYIIGMDRNNVADLQALAPPGCRAEVHAMMSFAANPGRDGVPDPYYTGDYEGALDLIEAASAGLLDALKKPA